VKLICFTHAGGAAWTYRRWPAGLPESVETCAVELPGHGNRIRETLATQFDDLIPELMKGLQNEFDRPLALFGHSLGALLAFETAHALRTSCGVDAAHLFVSGYNAPQLDHDVDDVSQLDDEGLIDKIRELNCTPETVLQNRELMQLMLPVIRADFELCRSYVYRQRPPLNCPLTVLGGIQDPRTDRQGLEAWRVQTRSSFALRHWPGDHFFVAEQETAVLEEISRAIGPNGA
jgi:medium-chain acyl-[acyl-carrier-protein] hydrolase